MISSTLNTSAKYQTDCCVGVETGVCSVCVCGGGGGGGGGQCGIDFELKMLVKLRSSSGVLLAVQGRQDYLILQILHDGNLTFTAENGNGPITATFQKSDLTQWLSNDNWHDIHGQYCLLLLQTQFSL